VKTKKLFSSKVTFLILLILAAFLGRQKYQQYKQNQLIEKEKQKIIAQINSLNKKNQEISNSLEYFKSESFKQRVAREQLNLKQPGEQVYSFKEANENALFAKDQTELPKLSNIEKEF
jgi:cell division protein FtsB